MGCNEKRIAIEDDSTNKNECTGTCEYCDNKKLFKKQRDFLHTNCSVPSKFTEPVRQYLLNDKDKAFECIMQSKAKPIKGNKDIKQAIIKKIEIYYDEYMALKAD